jgi:hypothetical protein
MSLASHGHLDTSKWTDLSGTATAEQVLTVAGDIVYGVEVDNTGNSVAVYFKGYDLAAGISVGTTDPDDLFVVEAGEIRFQPYSADASGKAMVAGYGFAVVTEDGTGGTTSPPNDVRVGICTD